MTDRESPPFGRAAASPPVASRWLTAIRAGRIIARTPRRPRSPRLPERPSARIAIAIAAAVTGGAAFGIGFAVGTPSSNGNAPDALETVAGPDAPAVPSLRSDLAELPPLLPAPVTGGGGGGPSSSGSSGTGAPEEPVTVVPR